MIKIKPLRLYEEYSREEVHDIFDPTSSFTSRRGPWGAHGVVKVTDRPGDFVFFVTFGQSQAGHVFNEAVTEDGIITWQSQPSQHLASRAIKQFIHHNHFLNNIHLFLRTSKTKDGIARPYIYLGKLAYISHDIDREMPVYFKWQILEWDLPVTVAERMGLTLQSVNIPVSTEPFLSNQLYQTDPPDKGQHPQSIPSQQFKSRKVDHVEINASNKQLGNAGELLAFEYEKEYLQENGRADLAGKVTHVAAIEGDGAGYDIRSYNLDGSTKYIEVKTTTGGIKTPFYLSINELLFSQVNQEHYVLYRVFQYNKHLNIGSFFVLTGDVSKHASLEPIQFKAKI